MARSKGGYTDFDIPHVLLAIENASEKAGHKLALQIEAKTKVNIQQNGQIDTGFMLNSTYTVSRNADTYGQADSSGRYQNLEGYDVERKIAPQVKLPSDAVAACAVGAEYAIYQEVKKSFLFAAAENVARSQGHKFKEVFLDNLTD